MEKIAFIISSSGWGGMEMNVLKLASWLKKRNRQITLYAVRGTKIYEQADIQFLDMVPIEQHRKYFDIRHAFLFSKLLKAADIQTVLVFDNKDLDVVVLTKFFFKRQLRIIYQQHMKVGINKRDPIHSLRFSGIDCWVSPLKKLKQEVIEKTRFGRCKIEVVPLGVELEQFDPPRYSKPEARNILGIHSNNILLGIIGRIDAKKGQDFLARAVYELAHRGVEVDLLIMGEPTINDANSETYRAELMRYISIYDLSDKIHIRGFHTDVHLFYQAIDIFVLASESETYGMVTIEAMLSMRPVIATNAGGSTEILENGELGLLYKFNDLNDFCNKASWAIFNKGETDKLTFKAKESAVKRFSHIHECELLEKILDMNYEQA